MSSPAQERDSGGLASNMMGDIKFCEPVTHVGRPPWYPPLNSTDPAKTRGLKMLNSLTGQMDDFAPAGDTVMWYTCGPTVYDWCHMGHARSFMTFDILRRILEDYFGFKTLVQINITDIDDKIIKRARRNKLIEDYTAENTNTESADVTKKVLSDMENAITKSLEKLDQKWEKLHIPLPIDSQKRERDLRVEERKAVTHKKENNAKAKSRVAAVKEAFEKGSEEVVSKLVKDYFDQLVAHLAKEKVEFSPELLGGSATERVASLQAVLDNMSTMINEDKLPSSLTSTMHLLQGDLGLMHTILTKGFVVAMIQSGTEELGDILDEEKGASITDHSVFDKLAKKFERAYMEDCKTLGIKEPDVLTRVTEYVEDIVDFVDVIVKKGFAYPSNGSVYIDLEKFNKEGHSYRKLSPATEDTCAADMKESEGDLSLASASEKKHPNDFALWKASKAGEPAWPSPWGEGRPGWHIECSVVASDIMGQNMDIHAGGCDLKFPHHDNELAQSEAKFGNQQWVNYFLHAGHLNIKGLKMSKSLKNFITIRQALKEHSPRQLRLMFLLQPWADTINFSDLTVDFARSREKTFTNFFGRVKTSLRSDWLGDEVGWRNPEEDRALFKEIDACQHKVHAALCNSMDTVAAMNEMDNLITYINKYLDGPCGEKPAVLLLKKAGIYMTQMLKMFGVIFGSDEIGFPLSDAEGGGAVDVEEVAAPYINAILEFRHKLKAAAKNKDATMDDIMKLCDWVRDEACVELGVKLEDNASKDVTTWKMVNPEDLRKEIEEKQAKKIAEKQAKKQGKIQKKLEEIEKVKLLGIPPTDLFKVTQGSNFSEYDADGCPTKDANGEKLGNKPANKLKKSLVKHTKGYESQQQKLEKDGITIDGLVSRLEAELDALRND